MTYQGKGKKKKEEEKKVEMGPQAGFDVKRVCLSGSRTSWEESSMRSVRGDLSLYHQAVIFHPQSDLPLAITGTDEGVSRLRMDTT